MNIDITLIDDASDDVLIPKHAIVGDAGVDLKSRVATEVLPNTRALIPTGIAIAIPKGYVGLVTPRSGLAIKHGITVVNSPGVIDSGYRGEIAVILHNLGQETFNINKYDRIAQLLILPFEAVVFNQVNNLETSSRGIDGFGSTGK